MLIYRAGSCADSLCFLSHLFLLVPRGVLHWCSSSIDTSRCARDSRVGYTLGTKPKLLFARIFDWLPFTPPLVAFSVPQPDIVKICWLAPVIFPFRIGRVFHVKSSYLLWFDLAVLRRFFAVVYNIFIQSEGQAF